VTEPRLYAKWSTDQNVKSAGVATMASGITSAKKAINSLHDELGKTGFEQVRHLFSCCRCLIDDLGPVQSVAAGDGKVTYSQQ